MLIRNCFILCFFFVIVPNKPIFAQTEQGLLKQARTLALKNHHEQAETYFRKALKQALTKKADADFVADLFFYRQFNFQNHSQGDRAKDQLDSLWLLLPDNNFKKAYRKYHAKSYFALYLGDNEKAFIQLNKAIELAEAEFNEAANPEVLLNLYFDRADLVGRLGNKQSEIEQHRSLLPKLQKAQMHEKMVQAEYGIAVHFYGFNQFDSCYHYMQLAQKHAQKHAVMADFIGLFQYDAVCLSILGEPEKAETAANKLEQLFRTYKPISRQQKIQLAEVFRIHSRFYSIKGKPETCLSFMNQAIALVENEEHAWSAKAAMYAYKGRLCIVMLKYDEAQNALLKQIECRLRDHHVKVNPFTAPPENNFEPNMYSVSALGNYAEAMYYENASKQFADSLLNAGVISYSARQMQLLWLALERLPDYTSRLLYLERMERFFTFYATAIFQQHQNVGLPENALQEFYQHTSYYHQQFLRSSNEKKTLIKQHSGSDSLFVHLMKLNSDYHKAEFSSNSHKRDSLDAELVQLNTRLSSIYPEKFKAYYQSEPVSITAIQKQLKQDECLVVYEKFYINLYQLVLTKDSLFFDYLYTTPDIDSLIAVQEQAMQHANSSLYATSSYQLFKKLFLHKLPDKQNIHIVPVSNLNSVPFDALVTDSVVGLNFKQLPYWMLSNQIRVWSSLYEFWRRDGNEVQVSKYLAAAPSFKGEAAEQMLAMRSADRSLLVGLPGAKQEVQRSATFFSNATLLTDHLATEQGFKANLANSDIIHLATHALLDENPLRSRLFFGETDSTDQDGILFAQELMAMDLQAKLAILSACNTGSGTNHFSEGYQSLAYAFAYGGCPNVLMTFWNSSDEASSGIITDFVAGIAKGATLGDALSSAKKAYLNKSDDLLANPYYWSGFGIFGNLDTRLKVEKAQGEQTHFWWIYILFAAFALGILTRRFWLKQVA